MFLSDSRSDGKQQLLKYKISKFAYLHSAAEVGTKRAEVGNKKGAQPKL